MYFFNNVFINFFINRVKRQIQNNITSRNINLNSSFNELGGLKEEDNVEDVNSDDELFIRPFIRRNEVDTYLYEQCEV